MPGAVIVSAVHSRTLAMMSSSHSWAFLNESCASQIHWHTAGTRRLTQQVAISMLGCMHLAMLDEWEEQAREGEPRGDTPPHLSKHSADTPFDMQHCVEL